MNEMYFLKYPNGGYVGLDDPSGGYPYEAEHPNRVKFWATKTDAEDYAHMMRSFARPRFGQPDTIAAQATLARWSHVKGDEFTVHRFRGFIEEPA